MMQFFITPEGGVHFNNEEEILEYVAKKCGKDVADWFRDYTSMVEVLYENSPCDFEEILREYELSETKNPIVELKNLRKLKESFEDLLTIYRGLYNKV